MVEREKTPYGYIYRATNVVNDKVYLGQTTTDAWREGKIPIEERWKNEVREAFNRKARGENLRYIENAIIKYGSDNFELTQEDVAKNQEELNEKEKKYIKEYDSMNPDKGYNMMEGGEGGRMSEMAKEKMSKSGSEKWQNDLEYREKQTKERQERVVNNPDWIQKMTEINQEIARNPNYQENMSKALSEKWQESKFQESVSNGMKEKWKDEKFRERQARTKAEGKREIQDKGQFLRDITEMAKKDIITKYDMDGKSINNRIEEMLKHQDVRTYSEAKKYLEDKNIQGVLKDIEERQGMEQKPDFREKMTEINREKAKDPEWRKRVSEAGTKKWQEKEYREKQGKERQERAKDPEFLKKMTEINRARAKDPQWLAKMREINKQYRKEIPDKREFLKEIKENMSKKEMLQKYDMGGKTLNRRVQEMFGPDGPRNYTELKDYMQDKNVGDVLKEIEERNKEKEIKPESQGEVSKDKGESKSQDDLKEKTDKDTKSDEKEDLKEPSKEESEDNKSDKNEENSERNQNQENSDEDLREKGEKSAEIEENIESKSKEETEENTSKEREENNVKDSEENKSKDSSISEKEAKFGKDVENIEKLKLTGHDYAGIDKDSSKKPQDIKTCEENPKDKDSESIKEIYLNNEDIESIVIVKDITADEEKDYSGVDEGAANVVPDFAFIDKFLDHTIGNVESKSDKIIEGGKEYFDT